jgi:hypothetical protein
MPIQPNNKDLRCQVRTCIRAPWKFSTFWHVVIVILGILAVACSIPPRRTEAERTADANIAAQVNAVLAADPNIYARHIEVAVDRDVVHLGGFVFSSEDYQRARHDAASVPGVKTVNMQMELMRGGVSGTK